MTDLDLNNIQELCRKHFDQFKQYHKASQCWDDSILYELLPLSSHV